MEKHTPNKMLLCSHALFVVQGGKGAHVVCGGQRLPKPMVERALIKVYETVVLDQQR